MDDNEYICENCNGVFEKRRTDEEAMNECIENGFDPEDELAVICDDCYKRIIGEWHN